MLDSSSNTNQNLQPFPDGTIIVNTAVQGSRSKQKGVKEGFRKGRQKTEVPQEPCTDTKLKARNRLMITFKSEAGYRLLLEDREELKNLKKNSYLDQDFVVENNMYRVHLYYKRKLTTRISHWAPKYPQIEKTVERDDPDFRITIDLNNSLSRAIAQVESECEAQRLQHKNPPTPPEHIKGTKKVRANEKKTKGQLITENQKLHAEVVHTQNEMQALLKRQNHLKMVFSQLLQKLSPTSKMTFENLLDNDEGEEKKVYDVAADLFPDSPISRISTEKGNKSANMDEQKKILEEMDILFSAEHVSEKQEDKSSSSFIGTSDEEVKFIEEPLVQQTLIIAEQNIHNAFKTLPKNQKKTKEKQARHAQKAKSPWSHLSEGVLTIWRAIKANIQSGRSEEEIRQDKNTPGSWKPVLHPKYEHYELFQEFLKSHTD